MSAAPTAPLTAIAREERWVSVSVVARRLKYSERTIRRRCDAGAIPAHRLTAHGEWRVSASWLAAELAKIGAVIVRRRPTR